MMARPRRPLFLARAPYRRRRLRDAARLLPVFGAVLMILPLMWSSDGQARLTSGDVIYFFGLWALLILVAAAFAPGLRVGEQPDEEED
jgi:hypothetical protein